MNKKLAAVLISSLALLFVSCSDDTEDTGDEGTVSNNAAPQPTSNPNWGRVVYAEGAHFASHDCLNPSSYSIVIHNNGDYEILNLDEECNNSWFGRLEQFDLDAIAIPALEAASFGRTEKKCEGGHQFHAPVVLSLYPASRGNNKIMEGTGENFCWRGSRSAVENLSDAVTNIAEKIINRPQ